MDTLRNWTAKRAGGAITIEHSIGKIVGIQSIAIQPSGKVLAKGADKRVYNLEVGVRG